MSEDNDEVALTSKEIKQRHFDKKYREAKKIQCACGCGTFLKSVDRYARPKKFINGHNGRKYEDPRQFKREWNHRNKSKRKQYKKHYHRHRKQKLIAIFNNKCQECQIEYDGTNACIFHFHHLNPLNKTLRIS